MHFTHVHISPWGAKRSSVPEKWISKELKKLLRYVIGRALDMLLYEIMTVTILILPSISFPVCVHAKS